MPETMEATTTAVDPDVLAFLMARVTETEEYLQSITDWVILAEVKELLTRGRPAQAGYLIQHLRKQAGLDVL